LEAEAIGVEAEAVDEIAASTSLVTCQDVYVQQSHAGLQFCDLK